MSFARKMWLGFGLVMLLTAFLGASFVVSGRMVNERAVSLTTDSLPGVYVLGDLKTTVLRMTELMLKHINSIDAAEMDGIEGQMRTLDSQIRETIQHYAATWVGAEEKPMCDRLIPAMDKLMANWSEVRIPSRATQNDAAMKLFRERVVPVENELSRDLQEEYDYNKKNADHSANSLLSTASIANALGWIASLLALALAAALATYLIRDTSGKLNRAINVLTTGMGNVREAASQFATGSQTLAQGANQQAASLQETSASGNQISAMTQQNTHNAAASATLMTQVEQNMTEANDKLKALSAGMEQIGDSSQQIARVIKVIDEIAFQTNILALNAAVEAARAGEAGMGFAVVADEVRALAQRCAQATGDISRVIEQAVTNSQNGQLRLGEVSKVIAQVTERTTAAKKLIDQLHVAGVEQARGMQQISTALSQLEQVTQKVAASAEESASASTELDEQADAISATVGDLQLLVAGS